MSGPAPGRAAPGAPLAALLERPDIRRGGALAQVASASVPTGFPALDAELPGGGWPTGCLTECLPAHEGIGELRILGPALAALSRAVALKPKATPRERALIEALEQRYSADPKADRAALDAAYADAMAAAAGRFGGDDTIAALAARGVISA